MTDLHALASHDVFLRRVASTDGGEWAGPCPHCGGRDRFRMWSEKGRYWCRQCNRKGDAIQYLRDFRGLSFTAAKQQLGLDTSPPTRVEVAQRRAHHIALEAARDAYRHWQRCRLDELCERFRDLERERSIAECAYRAMMHNPSLLSESEQQYWEQRLARLCDFLAPLEWSLDVLTFRAHECARFKWWQEEVVINGV